MQKPRKPLEHGFIKRLNLKYSIEICGRTLVPASPVKVELDYSFDGDAINAKAASPSASMKLCSLQ